MSTVTVLSAEIRDASAIYMLLMETVLRVTDPAVALMRALLRSGMLLPGPVMVTEVKESDPAPERVTKSLTLVITLMF